MTANWIKTSSVMFGCAVLFFVSDSLIASRGIQQDGRPRISISSETTRIEEPLDAGGYIDYQVALSDSQLAGVDANDNFALVLWQVLGEKRVSESDRRAFFGPMEFRADERLVLKPWVSPEEFFGGFTLATQLDEKKSREFFDGPLVPWQQSEAPAVAAFLTTNGEQLDYLASGLSRLIFAQPYVGDKPPKVIGSRLYGILELRQIGRLFAQRAMFQLGRGNLDGALEDALACHRIGGYLIQRATEVEVSTGFEICRWAAEAERSILADETLDRERAATHFEALQKFPASRDLAEVIDRAGRWSALDIAQLNARYAGKSDAPSVVMPAIPLWAKSVAIDYDESMQVINRWYDRGVEAVKGETHLAVLSRIQEIYRDLESLQEGLKKPPAMTADGIGGYLGEIWVTSFYPNIKGLYLNSVQTRAEYRLVLTGYAIRLYEIEKQAFPDKLNDLSGRFIKERSSLIDPYTGQPFQMDVQSGQVEISATLGSGKRRRITIPGSDPVNLNRGKSSLRDNDLP